MVSSTTPRLGPRVAAGARDLLDEEGADLRGELGQPVRGQRLEVAGAGDPFQQAHGAYLLVLSSGSG